METMQAILSRKSVRSYTGKKISKGNQLFSNGHCTCCLITSNSYSFT